MKNWVKLPSILSILLCLSTNSFAAIEDFIGADHWDEAAMTVTTSSSLDDAHNGLQTVHGMAETLYNNMYVYEGGWGVWLSASGGGGGISNPSPTGFTGKAWIAYNFGQSYMIKDMLIWNCNHEAALARGLKRVAINVSKDGTNWTTIFSGDLHQATGEYLMGPTDTFNINSEIQFVVIDCTANFSPFQQYYGLSEVRFNILNTKAISPYPANAVTDANTDSILTWKKGSFAAAQGQDVYFGTNLFDVRAATASAGLGVYKGRQDANSYNPGLMQMGKTYYWRVDQVNGTNILKGDVWSFATDASIGIDDFDGLDNLNDWQAEGGASLSISLAPCGGPHALKIAYNNSTGPFYSAATRYFSPVLDLKSNGLKSLRLQYRGLATNGTSRALVFVKLYDNSGRQSTVWNADLNAVKVQDCNDWMIDMAKFTTAPNPTAFDLAHVSQIVIGVGDSQQPTGAASGEFLIDQIGAFPVGCGVYPPGSERPAGDINDDCAVNMKDLRELVRFWLYSNVFP